MKIFFHFLAFLTFILLFHCNTPKEAPIALQLSVEQYHSLTSSTGVLVKYFKITIDKKVENEDVDLVVMVRPVEDTSDPDIFISTSNQNPDSYSNSDQICSSNGLDVCTIPSSNITNNATFYIGIKCYTQCSFALKASYDTELFFTLQENPNTGTLMGSYNLEYLSKEAKILKFYVPLNNKNYQRILVKAQQVHPSKINESFYIYMNEENGPPTTSRYHFKGLEAWNSGQCILISDSFNNLWSSSAFGNFSKSDVNYTLLVMAPTNSSIQVTVQAYNDLMKVKLQQNLQDMVYMDKTITYELDIDESTFTNFQSNNLLLTLTAFSGNPDIYVNPDTLPTSLIGYKWKSIEDGKESLIITSKERSTAKATNKKFFITIYGKLTSTFSLWIGTSNDINYLTFGVTQTGAISTDELINYRLFVFSDEDMNITAILNTESGNPDLYVKLCLLNDSFTDWRMARDERRKCFITAEDVKNRYLSTPENAEMFLYSDNVGGKDAISFKYDSEKCMKQNSDEFRPFSFNKCMYVIAVHGNCNWQNESEFSLVVTHSQHHIILTEGTPQRNRADLRATNYFKFTLMDGKNIESLKFHITEISGKVTTYVSKKNRYPMEKDYEKMSYSHWGSLNFQAADLVNSTDKSLAGTYYLAVFSETAATYSILTTVKRGTEENQEEQSRTISLSEGVPQYYSFLYDPNERHYFSFRTSFYKANSDVMIHLTPLRGAFRLYILNTKKSKLENPTTTEYHFILEPNQNTLTIRNTSDFWSKKANYVILVLPLQDNAITTAQNLFEFVIQYSTSESMKTLSSHNPLREAVQNDSYSFYRCEVHKGDESIEISINVHTFNPYFKTMLQVFFSFQSSNPFPAEKNNEFNTTVQNNIWILVENSDLTTNCPYLFDNNLNYSKQCVFYMSVRAFEADVSEITYSISTKRNYIQKPVTVAFHELTDNAPQSVHYSSSNPEPLNFLYKLEKTQRPLHISAFTQEYYYGANFVLYANFHPLSNITSKVLNEYFPKPNEKEVSFVVDSQWHHSISFTIYEENFKNLACREMVEGCGLFLSIYLKNETNFGYYNPLANSSFTIQVTRKLLTLTPGVPFNGLVIDNEIKYFRFEINEEKTTVLISVTPLNDGDPDLIVNRGINKEWPDLFNYEYGSKLKNSDQVSIEHQRDNNTENNTYVIGVYGKKNCSFVLTATYGDFKMINLYSGSPVAMTLKAKDKIYFKYTNYALEEDFRVIFSKEYGEYLFAMTTLKDNEDFIEKLPNFKKKNYFWSNLDTKDLDHIFIQKGDKNYCGNCSYVLMVEAEKESSFTLLTSGSNSSVYLQHAKSFKDFVLAKNNNSYVTYFYEDIERIIVNILVYQGKIKATLFNSSEHVNLVATKTNDNTNNVQLVFEPGKYFLFYTMVSVLIEGLTSSNYTISIHGEGKDRNIRHGITEYGEALPFVKYNFTFYSNADEESEQYYSVTLKSNSYYNISSNLTNNSINSYSVMTNTTINIQLLNTNETNNSNYIYISRSSDYIFARFKAKKGDYLLTVDNSKNTFGFSYNILLSFSGMDLIYPDMEYMNYLSVGKANYYQLLIENNSKILVELFQCYGKNRLFVASNQNNILNHQSDLISELDNSISSNQVINLYDTKNLNEIYIAVKSIEGGNIDIFSGSNNNTYKISRYLIKTHYYKSGQTPYELFYPGNDGKLFFIKDGDNLKFAMKRLNCEKDCRTAMKISMKNSIKYYKYTIRFNYDASYLEESVTCFQLYNGTLVNTGNELEFAIFYEFNYNPIEQESDLTFSLNIKDYKFLEDTPYYAKVVAQVFVEENNGIQPYSFFYKTVEFYPGIQMILSKENQGSGLIWIFVIVLIALVGALVAAFFFFTKYKKTEKQLNYELQDVSKVARVEDFQIQRKDYIGLFNENESKA